MLLFLGLPDVRESLFFSFSTKNSDSESPSVSHSAENNGRGGLSFARSGENGDRVVVLFRFPSKTVTVLNDSYGRLPSQRIFMGMGSMRSTRACSCLLERR